MNNFEKIKVMGLSELGHKLCELQDLNKDCESCPMESRCDIGKNGWIIWLAEEEGWNS